MKTGFLFTFFFLGFCIISCVDDDFGEGCGDIPPHFEILGIGSSNLQFVERDINPYEILNSEDTISWDAYFTRFQFEMAFISSNNRFGASVMALSCVPIGYKGDKIGIEVLTIKTANDYNENYPAGSVINDIVLTNIWTYTTDDFSTFKPVSEYIDENADGVMNQTFELKLTEAPQDARSFSFDITYTLNNGEEFQHRTTPVILYE